MDLKRRAFLKLGGLGLAAAGLNPRLLWPYSRQLSAPDTPFTTLREQLLNEEFPFPYDDLFFQCAERIYNVRPLGNGQAGYKANLNLVVKDGKALDLKILTADTMEGLAGTSRVQSFSGVRDIMDVELESGAGRRLYYQVQYREGTDAWKALSPKSFKLPNANLAAGDTIKVLLISDDHTFDDADYDVPDAYKASKLSGDYVNELLRKLRMNPDREPPKPLSCLQNGLCLARTLRYIMAYEDPDLLLNLGDSNGIGAGYKWAKLGLPASNLTDKDYDYICRVLWLRMRKIYSAVTPSMPVYLVQGNHDGEEQWNSARFRSLEWRKKLFDSPFPAASPAGGPLDGQYYAVSLGEDADHRGGVQFVCLHTTAFTGPNYPARIDQWTLGQDQIKWFEQVLKNNDRNWTFACLHHVLGGWPAGSDESRRDICYGRGPLFTAKDYQAYANPEKVEQVKLTQLGLDNGLNAFFYGHDHIFSSRNIGTGLNNKDMLGVCVGSTKYMGESSWWGGSYWLKHYGSPLKTLPDFWGPSGLTRITLKDGDARIDYIVTNNAPYSNIPSTARAGTVLSSRIMVNPLPSLVVEKSFLQFRAEEGKENPEALTFRVRNCGARAMRFSLTADQPWISCSPAEGVSYGRWADITVRVESASFVEGSYQGRITVSSAEAVNGSLTIPVQLIIDPPPILAPLNFKGVRVMTPLVPFEKSGILLTWQDNPSNRRTQKFRVYKLDDRGQWAFLQDVEASTLSFLFRSASCRKYYRFAVSAVDQRNREGEKAFALVT